MTTTALVEELLRIQIFPFDPGELEGKYKRRRYARSRLYLLTCEYIKLRSDFRIATSSNWQDTDWHRKYATACQGYLENAKKGLESRRPRIFFCASMLDLAAGSLVWLYERETVELRSKAVTARLKDLPETEDIKWLLSHLDQAGEDVGCKQAALVDTLEYLSRQEQRLLMEDSLQVTRLRRLLLYVGAALALLIVAAPFVTIKLGQGIPGWPVIRIGQVWLTQGIYALAVAAFGAVGGIFSGLIKARDSNTTLDEYRTSMLKLALKPLVGAAASLTMYLFLGWQITGVRVTNGGTFLLVGFLAGFSERYFLRLLGAPSEDSDKERARQRDQLARVRDQLVCIITGGSLPPPGVEQRQVPPPDVEQQWNADRTPHVPIR